MMKFKIFTLIILFCGFTLQVWVFDFNREIDETPERKRDWNYLFRKK